MDFCESYKGSIDIDSWSLNELKEVKNLINVRSYKNLSIPTPKPFKEIHSNTKVQDLPLKMISIGIKILKFPKNKKSNNQISISILSISTFSNQWAPIPQFKIYKSIKNLSFLPQKYNKNLPKKLMMIQVLY